MTEPLKTRYAIIEPGKMRPEDLISLTWHPVEFAPALPPTQEARRKMLRPLDEVMPIDMKELCRVLDPLFPGTGWERVAVNSFKGPLIYWTATILHGLARSDAALMIDIDYADLRKRALLLGAKALAGEELASGLYRDTPRIYGRAVLFEDRIWF